MTRCRMRKKKISFALSNSVPPFDYVVKAGQSAHSTEKQCIRK